MTTQSLSVLRGFVNFLIKNSNIYCLIYHFSRSVINVQKNDDIANQEGTMKERLDILLQAGVIDQDVYQGMLTVIDQLQAHRQAPLPEEQGWMAIAHMANALMRSQRQEIIEPLDNELLTELAAQGDLASLQALNQRLLQNFAIELHPNEEGYLLVNWYGLCQY
jgi:hypothetical protein